MDAMAAMVKNTNRDFRQRQSWVKQQKRPTIGRRLRHLMLLGIGLASICAGLSYLWARYGHAVVDAAPWSKPEANSSSFSLFGLTMGLMVVSSFILVASPALIPYRSRMRGG
jgi:uncharacterized membrane protein